LEQAAQAIAEANSYIQGAKFAHHLVPRWVHLTFWPVEIAVAALAMLGSHPPEAFHLVAGGLAGAQLYGHLVWLSVSGRNPDRFGWYLLANEGKKNAE
jgi:hypothetical protein